MKQQAHVGDRLRASPDAHVQLGGLAGARRGHEADVGARCLRELLGGWRCLAVAIDACANRGRLSGADGREVQHADLARGKCLSQRFVVRRYQRDGGRRVAFSGSWSEPANDPLITAG